MLQFDTLADHINIYLQSVPGRAKELSYGCCHNLPVLRGIQACLKPLQKRAPPSPCGSRSTETSKLSPAGATRRSGKWTLVLHIDKLRYPNRASTAFRPCTRKDITSPIVEADLENWHKGMPQPWWGWIAASALRAACQPGPLEKFDGLWRSPQHA